MYSFPLFKATVVNYYTIDRDATTTETIYRLTIPERLNRQLKYDLKFKIFSLATFMS